LVIADAQAFALEVLRSLNGRAGMNIDAAMSKRPGRENRQSDKALVALGAENAVRGKRHFRTVEFLVIEHAPKNFSRAQWKKIQFDTFRLYAAFDQSAGSIIVSTGEG
jgi:hypothetical protein